MDVAVIVAVIALAGTVGNVGLTYFFNVRSERQRALRLADAVWKRQCASLEFAADELQDRIDNILNRAFLDAYGAGRPQKDEAITSTLFRFCQYFGWAEILNRAMRIPDPRHATSPRELERLQGEVGRTFASDAQYGAGGFMVWRETQRALGELMITKEGEVIDTLGVADFFSDLQKFRPWLSRMESLMTDSSPASWPKTERDRLRDIQLGLQALVAELRRAAST